MSRRARSITNGGFFSDLTAERRNALLLYGGLAVLVILVIALVGYSYYADQVKPKHETVLAVGSRKWDVSAVQRRLEYDVSQGTIPQQLRLDDAVRMTVGEMEREEMLRQVAVSKGIPMDKATVEKFMRTFFGLPEDAGQDQFAGIYRQQVLLSGLHASEFRDYMASLLARQELGKVNNQDIPTEGEQTKLHIIQVQTLSEAQDAKAKLAEGEDFRVIASRVSLDQSKSSGGDLGWVPREALSTKIEGVAFGLPVGETSDVVEAPDGFFILRIDGRETRPIDDTQKRQIANRRLENAIEAKREELGSTIRLSNEQIDRIVRGAFPKISGG